MSLVAYGSSDDSEDSEIDDVNVEDSAHEKKTSLAINSPSQNSSVTAVSPTHEQQQCDQATSAATIVRISKTQTIDVDPETSSASTITHSGQTHSLTSFSYSNDDLTSSDIHISDEEDDIFIQQNTGLNLPAPIQTSVETVASFASSNSSKSIDNLSKNMTSSASLLNNLPAPRSSTFSTGVTEEEDELEDIVKPKESELALKQKPPSKKKMKQPVKIIIPTLPDSDSDDDQPRQKKQKSSGKCGLFTLLPAPKHVSVKESGRQLLPYSISKKKPVQKSAASKSKPSASSISAGLPGKLPGIPAAADSDSDEDESEAGPSFFSLGTSVRSAPALSAVSYSAMASMSTLPGVSRQGPDIAGKTMLPKTLPSGADTSVTDTAIEHTLPKVKDEDTVDPADAPLVFKKTNTMLAGDRAAGNVSSHRYGYTSEQHQDSQSYIYSELPSEPMEAVQEEDEVTGMINDEQFLRMQGKSRRGREEISWIEVKADDHMGTSELSKHMTEETEMMSYSKKKNKDLPSSQQKRKHQITWLAHKAKERELELKNQWADNRMTRKQTQSKYGF